MKTKKTTQESHREKMLRGLPPDPFRKGSSYSENDRRCGYPVMSEEMFLLLTDESLSPSGYIWSPFEMDPSQIWAAWLVVNHPAWPLPFLLEAKAPAPEGDLHV